MVVTVGVMVEMAGMATVARAGTVKGRGVKARVGEVAAQEAGREAN